MGLGINHIDKNEFLTIYLLICAAALSEKNVQSSFRATELILYNSEQVLACLNTQIHTPTLSLCEAMATCYSEMMAICYLDSQL